MGLVSRRLGLLDNTGGKAYIETVRRRRAAELLCDRRAAPPDQLGGRRCGRREREA